MADVIRKECDFKIHKGRKQVNCGQPVTDSEATPMTLEATRYLMDLCDEHKQLLRDTVLPFTSVAHDTSLRRGTHVRKAVQTKGGQAFTSKDVRKWMQDQGREVTETGRLPKDLIEEYAAAHGG